LHGGLTYLIRGQIRGQNSGSIFERREREGFAKCAEEDKKKIQNEFKNKEKNGI
jgi:hypothetical protein